MSKMIIKWPELQKLKKGELKMKSYIGVKIIQAAPMSEIDWLKESGENRENGGRDGYKVIYPDGYVSWSPKSVFDRAYREIHISEKDLILKEK